MPILVVERGDDKGLELQIADGNVYLFGRDPKVCAVVLSDNQASRRHFQIESKTGAWTLTDLNSTNGTFLNDEQVQSASLRIGDKIQVGDTILSLLSDQRQETQHGLVGKTLGGYEIIERVGRGGMGTVFKANALSLNREVAFKVLSSKLLKDSKFIEQFVSEARAAGQLNHPNIVQVYDVGKDRNIHFFSMEFMDGASLQDKIGKDGKLSWEEAMDVLEHAARALVFAERKGIVHRDVKPDNLMLTSDGQVKLADLGLARHLEKGKTAQDEGIFGTPHFISPEQAQGQEVDHRADIYSLGATAYRLLAGRTPFTGKNVSELVQKQINDEPEPLKQFAPDTPTELIDLISRMMKKNRDERPESASAVLGELEQIRLQYHLKAAGVGKGGKGVFIAVAVAVLAVAAVVVLALTKKDPPPTIITNGTQLPMQGTQAPEIVIRDDPEQKAKTAFLTIQLEEARMGRVEESWKTRRDEWLSVVKRYEQLAIDHAGQNHAKKAAARGKEIKRIIEEKSAAEAAALATASTAWNSLKAKVGNALDDGRYAEALKLLEMALADEKFAAALKLISEAREQVETWTSEATGSIKARFSAAFTARKADALELAKAGKYAEAVAALKAFLAQAAGDATDDPFGRALVEAKALAKTMGDELKAKLTDQIAADRALYYATYREIRHHATEATGDAPNQIFDFQFEAAAEKFAALLGEGDGTLVSAPYRDRAARKVASLQRIQGLVDVLIEKINSGDLLQARLQFPPAIAGGDDVTLEFNRRKTPVATREGIEVAKKIKVGGVVASSSEFVHFDRLSPLEFWELIFLSGQRFEMTPEHHAAAADFLAECGVELGLGEEIEAAGSALAGPEKAHLEGELTAITAWRLILDARADTPPENWNIAAGRFVEEHALTDYFLLIYGFDGVGRKALLPGEILNQFFAERLTPLLWE